MKTSTLSKILYLISALISLTILVGLFTFLPSKLIMGLTEHSDLKPSFYLLLLALLPILTNYICVSMKYNNSLNLFFFILINFLVASITLRQFGIIIPLNTIGILSLIIGTTLVGFYLNSIKQEKKYSINLKWVTNKDHYLKTQKAGAKLFFAYAILQTICLVLNLCSVLSINLTMLIPLMSFVALSFILLKYSTKLK